jgi:hypothetical protein
LHQPGSRWEAHQPGSAGAGSLAEQNTAGKQLNPIYCTAQDVTESEVGHLFCLAGPQLLSTSLTMWCVGGGSVPGLLMVAGCLAGGLCPDTFCGGWCGPAGVCCRGDGHRLSQYKGVQWIQGQGLLCDAC